MILIWITRVQEAQRRLIDEHLSSSFINPQSSRRHVNPTPTTFQHGLVQEVDIDTLAVLIRTDDLSDWMKFLGCRSGHKRINIPFVDDYTMQINQDALSVHIPITATVKEDLRKALRAQDICIFPSTSPNTLNSGLIAGSVTKIVAALHTLNINLIFVCGHGLKLSWTDYLALSNMKEQEWTNDFRTGKVCVKDKSSL